MQSLFKKISVQFICPLCVRCGSYQVGGHFFCKSCSTQFLLPRLHLEKKLDDRGLEIYTFLNWVPWESDSISEFIYLLKSFASQQAWSWLVEQQQNEICSILGQAESVMLIPVPGSKRSYHTQYLAEEIQQLTGCLMKSALRHKTIASGSQKTKTLKDRRTIEFGVVEDFTCDIASVNHIILIDDIYTSGSTITAAANAIKSELKLKKIKDIKISGLVQFRREKADFQRE